MGIALEVINTYGTGDGSATTLTHAADPLQSLAIRSSNGTPSAHISSVWAMMGAAADASIYSPRMHDDLHALQVRAQASNSSPLVGYGVDQPMYSQDSPTVQSVFGSAPSNGVAECLGYTVYYDDLPGVAANLQPWAQIQPQVKNYLGVKVSVTSGGTAGTYGAGAAINSVYDVFKANQPYALLGYNVSAECANVAIQGSDTGNILTGGPGAVDPLVTRDWFYRLEQMTGRPSIPVINSANKSSTNVFVSHTTASTTIIVDLIFAYLGA